MAKVFTITEGLQNMGALKTGGQGSVYKGRRIGEIITAIKLLPTPLLSENEEDKNYSSFKNEVEKLKKVNEEPNPNVVKILSSGITDSGNFPFIEMEFIEGPELGELLKSPHDPVFTIKETLKVAEHLSHALAHCHAKEVKHGDIKSNNIKYNIHSGNYILLDFGLSVMSDEQRRTSLMHAGAIEFMAPEQNEGQVLFQTDVYSFGIILYELLAGQVPFPLTDNGGTARNNVRIAHMEATVPDLLIIREKNLPTSWSAEKKEKEMQVPEWLLSLIYRCLQKNPEDRFKTGIELSHHIVHNMTASGKPYEQEESLYVLETSTLVEEKQQLENELLQIKQAFDARQQELSQVQEVLNNPDEPTLYEQDNTSASKNGISRTAFISVLALAILLAAFVGYKLIDSNNTPQQSTNIAVLSDSTDTAGTKIEQPIANAVKNPSAPAPAIKKQTAPAEQTTAQNPPVTTASAGRYKVRSVAYFHNTPDATTRRKAFINHWNKAILTPLKEQNGFIYIVYTNHEGKTSKGWLQKKDLIASN